VTVTLPAIVPDEMTGLREAEDSSAQLPGKICASHSCSSKLQPLSNFKLQIKGANAGQLANRCIKCMDEDAQRKKRKRDAAKNEKLEMEWTRIDLSTFFEGIKGTKVSDISLQVTVDTSEVLPVDLSSKERADGLAILINDVMQVYWS
jgi:hypothetical protein